MYCDKSHVDHTHLLVVFSEAMYFHSLLAVCFGAFAAWLEGDRLPEELQLICLWVLSRTGFFCKSTAQLQKPSSHHRPTSSQHQLIILQTTLWSSWSNVDIMNLAWILSEYALKNLTPSEANTALQTLSLRPLYNRIKQHTVQSQLKTKWVRSWDSHHEPMLNWFKLA